MLTTVLALAAALALPPKPARFVTDNAGVLSSARADALNARLAQLERDTSEQLLVYVDRDLPPDASLEQMSAAAVRAWGVGQKGKDNGAILFVFTNPRKIRLEVGYGLESVLTDARSRDITTSMRPQLRAGDYDGAVETAVDGILAAIHPNAPPQPAAAPEQLAAAQATETPHTPPPVVYTYLVLFGIFAAFVFLFARWGRSARSGGWSSSSSDGWSSSDSSSSSSSDSFSGGGGDSGGGGSSDSW